MWYQAAVQRPDFFKRYVFALKIGAQKDALHSAQKSRNSEGVIVLLKKQAKCSIFKIFPQTP